jgi:hypothetical protein
MLSRKIDRVRYQNQTSPQIWPFLIYFVMQILEPLETNVTGVKDIAAGGPFSIILKGKKYWSLRLKVGVVILISFILENGTVYGCGYGAVGLGDDIIETLEPTLIPFDEEVTRIFATQDMAAAITGKSLEHHEKLSISDRLLHKRCSDRAAIYMGTRWPHRSFRFGPYEP